MTQTPPRPQPPAPQPPGQPAPEDMLPPPALLSLPTPLRAAVFGASGGIGAAICAHLAAMDQVETVYAVARTPPALADGTTPLAQKTHALPFDITDEASIAAAAEAIAAGGPITVCIVATGTLQNTQAGVRPERSWRALDADAMAHVMAINTIGPSIIAKHMLDLLPREGKSVFAALSARVGSIGDNRLGGWHAYRASKAALNQVIRTLSIELSRKRPHALCVGLHPGTVDTGLSQPFQANVPTQTLFPPQTSAAHLLRVIDAADISDSGWSLAWDGTRITP